jgi:co-chaperonin GroES (HSP10)
MKETNFMPVNGRVVLTPEKEDEYSAGGIILHRGHKQEEVSCGFVVLFDQDDEHPVNKLLSAGKKVMYNSRFALSFKRKEKQDATTSELTNYIIIMKDNIMMVYDE